MDYTTSWSAAAARRKSMGRTRWRGLLSSTLLLAMAAPAAGSVVTYSDQAAWRSAAGSYVMENFDGLTAGAQISSLPALGIAFDKLGSYDAYPAIYDNNCGGNPTSGIQMLINFGYPCQFQPVGDLVLRPTPGSQILSLGYWNTGGDDTTKLEFFDASNQLLGSITSTSGQSFVGIVSDVGASWVRISEVAGNSIFSIDDLQVGTGTTSLPAPQTPILMLTGLLLAARCQQGRRATGSTDAWSRHFVGHACLMTVPPRAVSRSNAMTLEIARPERSRRRELPQAL